MAAPSTSESAVAWWVEFSEIVRNFGLLAAAVAGVVLAGMRVFAANRQADASIRQAELTRRTHVADLFNRPVEQLDHEKMEVRLAAIHTLRQLGADFPDLSAAAVELLVGYYIREKVADYGDAAPPADVVEIMKLVRDRRRVGDEASPGSR